jgi:hypothetical protein
MADENPFTEREASTLESKRGSALEDVGGRIEPDRFRELEQSVARCEAQIRALTQRVQEQDVRAAAARQRAVWLRLGLLFVLLAGYVYLRSRVQ